MTYWQTSFSVTFITLSLSPHSNCTYSQTDRHLFIRNTTLTNAGAVTPGKKFNTRTKNFKIFAVNASTVATLTYEEASVSVSGRVAIWQIFPRPSSWRILGRIRGREESGKREERGAERIFHCILVLDLLALIGGDNMLLLGQLFP